jgi:hypothetical protein
MFLVAEFVLAGLTVSSRITMHGHMARILVKQELIVYGPCSNSIVSPTAGDKNVKQDIWQDCMGKKSDESMSKTIGRKNRS